MIEPGVTRVWIRPNVAGTVRAQIDSQRIDVDWDDGLSTVVRIDSCRTVRWEWEDQHGRRLVNVDRPDGRLGEVHVLGYGS